MKPRPAEFRTRIPRLVTVPRSFEVTTTASPARTEAGMAPPHEALLRALPEARSVIALGPPQSALPHFRSVHLLLQLMLPPRESEVTQTTRVPGTLNIPPPSGMTTVSAAEGGTKAPAAESTTAMTSGKRVRDIREG